MAWCAARIAVSVCVGRSVSCRLADVEIGTSVSLVLVQERAMLVLKRRKGQEIVINGQIRIVVVQTNDGSCSLAFEAPDSYRIRRGELPSFDDPVFHGSLPTLQVQS